MKLLLQTLLISTSVMLLVSCEKRGDSSVTPQDFLYNENVNPEEIFSVQRNGHSANITIKTDFPACKDIIIARNTTGVPRLRYFAAILPPKAGSYQDTIPDAQPYYYWVRILSPSGKQVNIGPIRIDPDTEHIGKYIPISETYPWKLKRTEDAATISWAFPKEKYKSITLYRNTSNQNKGRTRVLQTLEWNTTYIDKLPDPQADYWYDIEAILANGSIITHGLNKAEFVSN